MSEKSIINGRCRSFFYSKPDDIVRNFNKQNMFMFTNRFTSHYDAKSDGLGLMKISKEVLSIIDR
jgi:hypothetical protein